MASRLVLTEPHSNLSLQEFDRPTPAQGQLEVEIRATSLNHLDWKRIEKNLFFPSFPHVLGMDIAGVVTNHGSSEMYHIGSLVMAPGTVGWSDGCSFQTHALINELHLIPEGTSFEEAATIPFSVSTAACGLFLALGLPFEAPPPKGTSIAIWGSTGNVGSFAVQLAKLVGYSVIAITSSESKTQRALDLGADYAFSNDNPNFIDLVKTVSPELQYVFDTVVSPETVGKASQCLLDSQGTIGTAIKYLGEPQAGITINSVFSGNVFGKTMTGDVHNAGLGVGKWMWSNLPLWLQEGKLRPLEYEVIGNLGAVEGGLKRMKEHNAPRKLVVNPNN